MLLPDDTPGLIKLINEENPERCIRPKESHEDHIRYAGRRDLINELNERLALADRDGLKRRLR